MSPALSNYRLNRDSDIPPEWLEYPTSLSCHYAIVKLLLAYLGGDSPFLKNQPMVMSRNVYTPEFFVYFFYLKHKEHWNFVYMLEEH